MSIHPTTSCAEVEFVCNSIIELAENHQEWLKDYDYDRHTNEFVHKSFKATARDKAIDSWFEF
jgi:hypothetical protein